MPTIVIIGIIAIAGLLLLRGKKAGAPVYTNPSQTITVKIGQEFITAADINLSEDMRWWPDYITSYLVMTMNRTYKYHENGLARQNQVQFGWTADKVGTTMVVLSLHEGLVRAGALIEERIFQIVITE